MQHEHHYVRWGLALLIGAAGVVTYLWSQPPAPASLFSGERAKAHSYIVAREIHPAGTAAAERVRDYIERTLQDLGLETEIQRTSVVVGRSVSYIENVIARIPGEASRQPFMLTTHYDSVGTGYGAADDGAGVVVMLELARTIKAMPPLRNDIVFVFTSDEERGQRGARACLEHPWVKNAAAVLGFEARGTYGPAFMFETSEENGDLIREFVASGANAQASSLMYEVHRRTPNTTDFALLKERGMAGYNVAFVGGLWNYHTENDNPDNLSGASIQQMGECALALVQRFGNREAEAKREPDYVFFNTLGKRMFAYPASWSRVVSAAALAAFLLALILGLRTRQLTILGIFGGVVLHLAVLALVALAGWGLMRGAYALLYVYLQYNVNLYLAALLALAAGVCALVYRRAGNRMLIENLQMGAMLPLVCAVIVTEYRLPLGSFAMAWPLLFCSLGLAIALVLMRFGVPRGLALFVQAGFVMPMLLLLIPGMQALHYIGAAFMLIPNTLLFVMLLGLLSPAIAAILHPPEGRWAAPALILAAAALLGLGFVTNSFSPDRPKMTSLTYAMNVKEQEAFWFSTDKEPDAWTAQFLSDQADMNTVARVFPWFGTSLLAGEAPLLPIEGPRIEVLDDREVEGLRKLRLRYISPAKVSESQVTVLPPARVLAAACEGDEIKSRDWKGYIRKYRREEPHEWSLEIKVMPRSGSVELELTVEPGTEIPIRIEEHSIALPDVQALGYGPRPRWMVTKANTLDWWERNGLPSGRTIVVDEIKIPATPAPAVSESEAGLVQ